MSTTAANALDAFKAMQRESWAAFAPLEAVTTPCAARLVRFAGVRAGQRVLDVACGTGVVAVTAAMRGANVRGLDLTPALLERARENSRIAGVDIDWREGDAEQLPYADSEFDMVLSQYGHMFAPRPDVCIAEMLRVLKPGGTIAFSTWPPELFVGRMFALTASYLPPPPPGVSPPWQWGDPAIVQQRLGSAVRDLIFDRDTLHAPALSPAHAREVSERSAGPVQKLVATLSQSDPARLEQFRKEYDRIVAEYLFENRTHQGYLMTRAFKS